MKSRAASLVSDSLFHYLVLGLVLASLFFIAWINAETPFRGEHWAMLYAFVKSPDWKQKIWNMINIEYFGDHRFQPLNSLPMVLGYLVFGVWFLGYYFASVAIHAITAIGFVKLLDLLRNGRGRVLDYPLELSFFLILFPCIDVLLWSYFHYIQIAVTLALFASYFYFKNFSRPGLQKYLAYLLILLAALIYEPLLVLLFLFIAINFFYWLYSKRNSLIFETVVPLICALGLASQYIGERLSSPITIPPNVSVLNGIRLLTGHDALFSAPLATNKFVFLLYNWLLVIVNIFRGVFLPATSHKTNLYELQNTQELFGQFLPIVSILFLIFAAAFLAALWKRRALLQSSVLLHTYLLAATTLIFGVICWARPGAGNYSSVQFRYAFVILPFLFAFLLDVCFKLSQQRLAYSVVLLVLISFNLSSSLNQGVRLKREMQPLTQHVRALKHRGLPKDVVVLETARAIHDYLIPVQGNDVFVIYNGRGGLTKFYGKM